MRCAALGLLLLMAAPVTAQEETLGQQLRESQARLEQIRREREQLQQQMSALSNQVHTTASELINIEAQVTTSAEALREIEFQATALSGRVDQVTSELLRARDRLRERRVVLRQRLRSIYKRGPLHSLEVLLSAETFADLLNRYKYLHLIALYDRLLVREVTRLERVLESRDEELRNSLAQLQRLRDERLEEFAQLQYLENQHEETLTEYRRQERTAQGRLEQLARDEQRVARVIEDLERRRIDEERRRVVSGGRVAASELNTTDMGNLDWPVEGRVVYRFGRDPNAGAVAPRRNGIGIAAAPGTPVTAVESGQVAMAGPFEGYGPSVIVSHGGGFYTLYHHLRSLQVSDGQQVRAGDVIGGVGGEQTPEGPHIEFQVRAPVEGGLPQPVDPLNWLQQRAGQ